MRLTDGWKRAGNLDIQNLSISSLNHGVLNTVGLRSASLMEPH